MLTVNDIISIREECFPGVSKPECIEITIIDINDEDGICVKAQYRDRIRYTSTKY